jgi:DNA-binding HxlR family transcriptional regulator
MKLEEITDTSTGGTGRSYRDACGAAHALDLVGERWTLLVMRELMLGPKRFGELRASLPGISANVLTQRLESLESSGIAIRRKLPPPASVTVYELTPWGYESEPIFAVLGRWAARSPTHDPRLPLSAVSLMLSFRTMFDAGRAGDFRAILGFRLGRESYRVRIEAGTIEAERASLDGSDALFEGPPPAMAALVYGGVPLDELETSGAVRFIGDRAVAERFATLFPLPPKAETPAPADAA